jgi:hypothetical protein
MLRSVWSRLHRRRSVLPIRDMFDADLDRARQKDGCALCRLVQEHDRHVMHSFLWQYCTDPLVGALIGRHWGFCTYHTWSLALLEHERLGDGMGISIVYQGMLKQLQRFLASQQQAKQRNLSLTLPLSPETGSKDCWFCHLAQQEEAQFLARLKTRFERATSSNGQQDWAALQTALCLPHLRQLCDVCWSVDSLSPWHILHRRRRRAEHAASQQRGVRTLATRLSDYIAHCVIGSKVGSKTVQPTLNALTPSLSALVGNREALPVHVLPRAGRPVSRQLLFITGKRNQFLFMMRKRSQFQSPPGRACPVCAASTSACIASSLRSFERAESLPSAAAFCQNHHWLLAACMLLPAPIDTQDVRERYRSWLKQQLEEQLKTLRLFEEERSFQREQECIACTAATEGSREAITSVIDSLRQDPHDAATPEAELICLLHWKYVQDACARKSDAIVLQKQFLHQQQQCLSQLEKAVEAYIARFNATKREHGEVPDVPGAAWAWERLLAFFVGEPTMKYTL